MITKISITPNVFKMGFPFLTRDLRVFSDLSDAIQYCIENPYDNKEIDKLNAWVTGYFLFNIPQLTRFFKYPISAFTSFEPQSENFDADLNLLPPLVFSVISAYILFGAIKRAIPPSGIVIETSGNTAIGEIVDVIAEGMAEVEKIDMATIDNARKLNSRAFMSKENVLMDLLKIRKLYFISYVNNPHKYDEIIAERILDAYKRSFMSLGLSGDFKNKFWTQKFSALIEKANKYTDGSKEYVKEFDFLCYFFYLGDNFATHTVFHHPDDVFEDFNEIVQRDGSVLDIAEAFMNRSKVLCKPGVSQSDEGREEQEKLIEFKFLYKSFFAKPESSASDFRKESISGYLRPTTASADFEKGLDMNSLSRFMKEMAYSDSEIVGLNYNDPFMTTSLEKSSLNPAIVIGALGLTSIALIYWIRKSRLKKNIKR